MHYVPVLMAVALVAILVAVVFVAIGRGGEMAQFPNDYAPPEFAALAATDVALLRPPTALWGYHMQATDEALNAIALAISERDVRIASLERQLADLRGSVPAEPASTGAGQPVAPAGRAVGGGPADGAAGPPARHARPAVPPPGGGPDHAESNGPAPAGHTGPGGGLAAPTDLTGSQQGAGSAGRADDTRAPEDSRTPAEDSRESLTSEGSGEPGPGWPQHPDRPAPGGGTTWPAWPGVPAPPPGPRAGTAPEPRHSHPQPGVSPRQQPDEEETW